MPIGTQGKTVAETRTDHAIAGDEPGRFPPPPARAGEDMGRTPIVIGAWNAQQRNVPGCAQGHRPSERVRHVANLRGQHGGQAPRICRCRSGRACRLHGGRTLPRRELLAAEDQQQREEAGGPAVAARFSLHAFAPLSIRMRFHDTAAQSTPHAAAPAVDVLARRALVLPASGHPLLDGSRNTPTRSRMPPAIARARCLTMVRATTCAPPPVPVRAPDRRSVR